MQEQTLETVPWTELNPTAPAYLFVPQNQDVREEYEKGWSVKDIFPVNSVGIVTGQDKKTVAFTSNGAESLAAHIGLLPSVVRSILYRPFDTRFVVYDKKAVTRDRSNVMRHMLTEPNIALVTVSKSPPSQEWAYVAATREIVVNGAIRSDNQSIDSIFPLYLHPEKHSLETEIRTNLAPAFVKSLTDALKADATPEEIFGYIYGVLHAPTYRTRFAEFLKRDFPRISLPPDAAAFRDMAALGNALVVLHLLEDPALNNTGIGFPDAGTNTVEKIKANKRYDSGRVRLNDAQSFTDVPADVWEYRVGGYQPAAKWLDDRAGRTLSDGDITHYQKMLAAMRETLKLLPQIDAVWTAMIAATPAAS